MATLTSLAAVAVLLVFSQLQAAVCVAPRALLQAPELGPASDMSEPIAAGPEAPAVAAASPFQSQASLAAGPTSPTSDDQQSLER